MGTSTVSMHCDGTNECAINIKKYTYQLQIIGRGIEVFSVYLV